MTAEWKLDPYAPYALVEANRPVPTTGPGAYVVVAGERAGGPVGKRNRPLRPSR